MRVSFIFAWVVMIMGVTTLSQERPKRDLLFIKKIIESLLGIHRSSRTEEHSRLYKMPGFDVVLKVSPRQSIRETEIINQVKRLLNLEVLSESENEEIQEFIFPLTAKKSNYGTERKDELYPIRSPVRTTKIINFAPNTKHESVINKVPSISIKPTHVKDSEKFRPKYFYKQTAQDGSINTFKSEGDHNIIVTETGIIPVLPPYIQLRLVNVDAKCTTKTHCSQPFKENSVFPFSRYKTLGISVPSSIAPSTYRKMGIISSSVLPPIMVERAEQFDVFPDTFKKLTYSPSYRVFKEPKYLVGQDFDGTLIVKEENPVLKKTTVTTLSKEGSKGAKPYNESKQNKINLDHQNPRNITSLISKKGYNSEKTHNHDFINERTNSQFSYKQIKHTIPAPAELKPKVVDDLKKDKIKLSDECDIIPRNYLHIPTLIENVSLSKLNTRTGDDKNDSNVQNLFHNSQNFGKTKTEIQYSFKEMPIIVADDTPYEYKQIKHDASSLITKGNHQNVSIESNTNEEDYNISNIIF